MVSIFFGVMTMILVLLAIVSLVCDEVKVKFWIVGISAALAIIFNMLGL